MGLGSFFISELEKVLCKSRSHNLLAQTLDCDNFFKSNKYQQITKNNFLKYGFDMYDEDYKGSTWINEY